MKYRIIIFTTCIVALTSIAAFGLYQWFIKGELRLDTILFFPYHCIFVKLHSQWRTGLEDQDERKFIYRIKHQG